MSYESFREKGSDPNTAPTYAKAHYCNRRMEWLCRIFKIVSDNDLNDMIIKDLQSNIEVIIYITTQSMQMVGLVIN